MDVTNMPVTKYTSVTGFTATTVTYGLTSVTDVTTKPVTRYTSVTGFTTTIVTYGLTSVTGITTKPVTKWSSGDNTYFKEIPFATLLLP
jgi:hypothetical protein